MNKNIIKIEQEMIDDNTLGIGEWDYNDVGEWDYNDVMDFSSEITYRLQDLKLIKGNDKDYNFEADDEMRAIICKKLNIGEE